MSKGSFNSQVKMAATQPSVPPACIEIKRMKYGQTLFVAEKENESMLSFPILKIPAFKDSPL